ncbi:hypothetical protein [Roseovarius nitratireducens]|uniref:hypothetical protein n=1 Tax=Roseovarius nitratireducens TaxID=2044597 RepID=UPI0013EC1B6B|nr:hypothetical protein [Roseovarius nitratireducens]
MLGILANTFNIATRTDTANGARHRHQNRPHRPLADRSDLRDSAELEAHLIARRRV